MSTHPFRVLFVCHGATVRSVLARAILTHLDNRRGLYQAYYADIHPPSSVYGHDFRVGELMAGLGFPRPQEHEVRRDVTTILRFDKEVDVVVCMRPIAPNVICDCHPTLREHTNWQFWSVPDPNAMPTGDGSIRAYLETKADLEERIKKLVLSIV